MNKLTPHHKGIIALVLGIASVAVSMIPNMALPGLVCGIVGLFIAHRLNRQGREPTQLGSTAVVLSVIGILMCALMLAIALTLNSYTADLQQAAASMPETATQAS